MPALPLNQTRQERTVRIRAVQLPHHGRKKNQKSHFLPLSLSLLRWGLTVLLNAICFLRVFVYLLQFTGGRDELIYPGHFCVFWKIYTISSSFLFSFFFLESWLGRVVDVYVGGIRYNMRRTVPVIDDDDFFILYEFCELGCNLFRNGIGVDPCHAKLRLA